MWTLFTGERRGGGGGVSDTAKGKKAANGEPRLNIRKKRRHTKTKNGGGDYLVAAIVRSWGRTVFAPWKRRRGKACIAGPRLGRSLCLMASRFFLRLPSSFFLLSFFAFLLSFPFCFARTSENDSSCGQLKRAPPLPGVCADVNHF